MYVKQLIMKLLNAKMDDKIFIHDEKTGKMHKIDFVNVIPSARNKGEVYLELWDKGEGD